MLIRLATLSDVDEWAALRAKLWSDTTFAEHRKEVLATLSEHERASAAFLAVNRAARICAFAEAALRHDYVNGCETSPVVFLEGVYVQPQDRGVGIGRSLCAAVQSWGNQKGCSELASDALLENVESHAFHKAIGFEETERVVYFRKRV